MAEAKFKAIVLDLFDTLVRWNPDDLPLLKWRGQEFHSTLPRLLPSVESALGPLYQRERFIETYMAVNDEINAERERDGIEILCVERFVRTLERLGISSGTELGAKAAALTRVHMESVRRVTAAPLARINAVRQLARNYRLGLLSNFDDSRTGWEVMSDTGVRELFEVIIISADLGLRKPNPKIFHALLQRLKLNATEVLFVGDTPHHDVAGAKAVGMSAAWVSSHALAFPPQIPKPDYIIGDLAELPQLLEGRAPSRGL